MATNRSVNIYISTDPKGELNKLNKELAKNKEALDSLGKSGTKCTKEMDRLEKESVELSKKIGDLNKGLKLNDLTISQLSDRQTALRATMRNTHPGTKEWNVYGKELHSVNIRLAQLNKTTRDADCGISGLAKKINQYAGTLASGGLLIQQTISKLIQLTTEYLKLDDALVSVRKRTGQTDEEVQELNNSLNGIQTRTSKEELLKLAEAAGQLGYTSNKDILPFVKVADRLRLVFSELGDEGVVVNCFQNS